jgi:hypothetical protein
MNPDLGCLLASFPQQAGGFCVVIETQRSKPHPLNSQEITEKGMFPYPIHGHGRIEDLSIHQSRGKRREKMMPTSADRQTHNFFLPNHVNNNRSFERLQHLLLSSKVSIEYRRKSEGYV